MIKVNVDVKPLYPSDDFYLQWMNICMWKLKFDVKSQLEKELNKQLEEY